MAALTFPTAPSNGDVFPAEPTAGGIQFSFNEIRNAWVRVGTGGGGGSTTVVTTDSLAPLQISETVPVTRSNGAPLQQGDAWYNNINGQLRTYVGSTWVRVTGVDPEIPYSTILSHSIS